MELKGKKVLVAGCKKSGLGAAQLLWKAGAQPVLFDENPDLDVEGLRKTAEFLTDVPVFLKALPKEEIRSLDLAVVSWGFRDRRVLEELGAQQIADDAPQLLEILTQTPAGH